jgi:hypothetical protein
MARVKSQERIDSSGSGTGGDYRVVNLAACYAAGGAIAEQLQVGGSVQGHELCAREAIFDDRPGSTGRDAVRPWQPRKYRVALHERVGRDDHLLASLQTTLDLAECRIVVIVPTQDGRDYAARIGQEPGHGGSEEALGALSQDRLPSLLDDFVDQRLDRLARYRHQ